MTTENDKRVDAAHYYPTEYQPFNQGTKKKSGLLPKSKISLYNCSYVVRGRMAWTKLVRINQDTKILDIGCGNGSLAAKLKSTYNCYVEGIEPSTIAAKNARANQIPVHIGTLRTYTPETQFDIITLLHVIEHVDDPLSDLKKVFELLKENGKVVIACPNANSIERVFFNKYWDGWDVPRHIHHFNQKSLHYMLEKAGFSNVQIYFELYSIIDRSLSNLFFGKREYIERRYKFKHTGIQFINKIAGLLLSVLKNSGAVQVVASKSSKDIFLGSHK